MDAPRPPISSKQSRSFTNKWLVVVACPLDDRSLLSQFLLAVRDLPTNIGLQRAQSCMAIEELLCGGESLDFRDLRRVDHGVGGNNAIDVPGVLSDEAAPTGIYRLEGHLNDAEESRSGGEFSAVGWKPLGDEGEACKAPDGVGVEGDPLLELWTHGCEPIFVHACVCKPVCQALYLGRRRW